MIYVEAYLYEEDNSAIWAEEAESYGAEISDKLIKKVTHLVFKDGNTSTYKKAKARDIKIVKPTWVYDSGLKGEALPVADYEPPTPIRDIRVKRARDTDQLTPVEKRLKIEDSTGVETKRYCPPKALNYENLEEFVVFLTHQEQVLRRQISKIPGVRLTDNLSEANCVATAKQSPCLEVAFALAKKLALVSINWLKACVAENRVLPIDPYKCPTTEVNPELFKNYTFSIYDKVNNKTELQDMIQHLGGTVSEHLRDADIVIIDSKRASISLDIGSYVLKVKSSKVIGAVLENCPPERIS